MTRDEIFTLLRTYQDKFKKWPAEPCPIAFDRPGLGRQIKHIRWMMDEMMKGIQENYLSSEEAHHWLGFIQAILWNQGFFTLEEINTRNTGDEL